jgi:hypothetical protein
MIVPKVFSSTRSARLPNRISTNRAKGEFRKSIKLCAPGDEDFSGPESTSMMFSSAAGSWRTSRSSFKSFATCRTS